MDESSKQFDAIKQFWDVYQAMLEESRIRPDLSVFYVKWAKAFVEFLPGKRPRNRSKDDIEAFLVDLSGRPGICGLSGRCFFVGSKPTAFIQWRCCSIGLRMISSPTDNPDGRGRKEWVDRCRRNEIGGLAD
jgi:hypothetical protein